MSTTKISIYSFIICLLLLGPSSAIKAQDQGELDRTQEIQGLTNFFEYLLNTLGASETSQRDKEIVISESYAKAFAGPEVQIEDDLLEGRKVITNKDVQSYLRDVDFFFSEVSFRFDSIEITEDKRPNGEPFYLVSFENTIKGTTVEGTPLKKIQKRYLEINLNDEDEDLKIVSVYSTKVSRAKELQVWYESLSFGWIHVFDQLISYDSLTPQVLQEMADIDSLDLSGNNFLRNVEPLQALRNLRHLDISNTNIQDLSPIRYASDLSSLVANNSAIENLQALQYFEDLIHLELGNSQVKDLSVLAGLAYLRFLDISSTTVKDFSALKALNSLQVFKADKTAFSDLSVLGNSSNLLELLLSETSVTDLQPLSQLTKLRLLDISETSLLTLKGLESCSSLEFINVGQTMVNSLAPLQEAVNLKKIEADLSDISQEEVDDFLQIRPETIVIINSRELRDWWDGLLGAWQSFYRELLDQDFSTKEDLIRLTDLDSIDVSSMAAFPLEEALSKLKKLRYVNVSNHPIRSLEAMSDMELLKVLIAENTSLTNLAGLEKNPNLQQLSLAGSPVKDITPLQSLSRLSLLDLEQTQTSKQQVVELLSSNPDLLIIWQSDELLDWWNGLSTSWKEVFDLSNPSSEMLHRLSQTTSLSLSGLQINDLSALSAFVNLQELTMDKVGIVTFEGIHNHQKLEILSCTNGPLKELNGLGKLEGLKSLNIANTAVDDLRGLPLSNLKKLNCAGTNVRKLRGIERYSGLEYIDLSNTDVFKLDRLFDLENPKQLICFNTRLRENEAKEFAKKFPECEVVYY
ncbi:MAG: leucine-rich repeat domain-containing protein [Bacteroidota bacterium]